MNRSFKLFALSLSLALSLGSSLFAANAPSTIANDDSCDVAVMPAATLLLPYFEVNFRQNQSETTVLTITNVTSTAQVARVTFWTDRSYPVINFNLYLTGYDTIRLNLFDIIARGIIAPDLGTGSAISPEGPYSGPNPNLDLSRCDELPGAIPQVYVRRMQEALANGNVPAFGSLPGCPNVGGVHTNAVGYATIDVVRTCGFLFPSDPGYIENEIAFDNALTGDYEQVNPTAGTEASNPLVHLRAIRKESNGKTEFPRTFYSRYQNGGTADARQPLPSTFAARWVDEPSKQTSYKIWREGVTGANAACGDYPANGAIPVSEIVVWDEEENVEGATTSATLPEAALVSIADPSVFPRAGNATAGWTYFNLDNGALDGKATQNWVIVSNRASDNDAAALGNGCTPETATSVVSGGGVVIGPAGN
ncbi:MAG TPA: hypothetical protein VHW00_14965 [Thermoanaerobaculia bacterium]|nr:hypothetical protein [Thermoanaerobaculia bacterium]